MGVFNQKMRCFDCGTEFQTHMSMRRFVGDGVPDGEIDLDICPECGSYSIEDAQMDPGSDDAVDDTCTVVFRLSKDQLNGSGFLYALACRTEGWKGVEILRIQLPEDSYEAAVVEGMNHE